MNAMPAPKLPENVLLEKIAEVFRLNGYEGASISSLSKATGLERASLYHRFPGGKEEMAATIVNQMCAWFESNVFEPLRTKQPPERKIRAVSANLRDFYRNGTLWCVLDAMTLGGHHKLRENIRAAYSAWLQAFDRVAREAGFSASLAQSRAQNALIAIEGSLVVARVAGDSEPFLRVIQDLPSILLKAE
jgi:AcrR family transcriptional regulator